MKDTDAGGCGPAALYRLLHALRCTNATLLYSASFVLRSHPLGSSTFLEQPEPLARACRIRTAVEFSWRMDRLRFLSRKIRLAAQSTVVDDGVVEHAGARVGGFRVRRRSGLRSFSFFLYSILLNILPDR